MLLSKSAALPLQENRESRERLTEGLTVTEAPLVTARVAVSIEEAEWLQRARQGDLRAFDWLLTRYRERAVRLAAHILRRPSEAEDLVQEAFLRAFAQIGRFRGEAGFYTWLYRIVVRLCLNRMRTPEWRQERELPQEDPLWQQATTDNETEPTETRILVTALLDQLSPPLRAALVLRELEGLDYNEIGEALGIPVGTVRSRLNAARGQFRTLWQQAMEEE